MDVKELFQKCAAQATKIVDKLQKGDYKKPTPDTQWDVRQLLGHMLYELGWTPEIVEGKTIAEVGNKYERDLLGGNPQQNWHLALARALDAVEIADLQGVAHLSYGDSTVEHYLREASADQLIHAWDLGRAIGKPPKFEEELAQEVHAHYLQNKDGLQSSGLFAAPIKVDDDADLQVKLLGLTGRQAK